MKRKKEAEKAEEREGTVMVRGGRSRALISYLPAVLLLGLGAANDIHCPCSSPMRLVFSASRRRLESQTLTNWSTSSLKVGQMATDSQTACVMLGQ